MASVLGPNQSLGVNQTLFSPNNAYELIMQSDGNLVLYRTANHHPLWASGTQGGDVMRATMQTDGNLVLYTFSGKAVWSSGTQGKLNSSLYMQNDGNLVIYEPSVAVWASNTMQH